MSEASSTEQDRAVPGGPFARSGRPNSGRSARTFKPRRGRLTPADQHALATLVPSLLLAPSAETLDLRSVFGRDAPLVVEVGFGEGETVRAHAQQHPEHNIIGIDVHTPGFAKLARGLQEDGSTNVRIVDADAIDVLRWMIPPASVAVLTTYFPDPWPKPGHHHKRLVQPDFAVLVAERLARGGVWRLATDWVHYAEQMVAVLRETPALQLVGDPWTPRDPARPITKFERRALRDGREIRHVDARRVE